MNLRYKILILLSFLIIVKKSFDHDIKSSNVLEPKSFKIQSNKRVLYLSIHSGTIDEMESVFIKRGINYTVSSLDTLTYTVNGYFISENVANKIINSGLVKRTCDEYDVIIVADTIPLGRPFYQASPHLCKSKIVLQITNRFDWDISDLELYISLMDKLVNNTNIYWQPNNDYDLYYLSLHKVYPKQERIFLIRPFGISKEKANEVKLKKTIIFTHSLQNHITNVFKSMNISDSKYEIIIQSKYGGPLTLKEHKLFVYIPYQFSTMKVFQNAYYGVFTAIPSPSFYKKMILTDKLIVSLSVMKSIVDLLEQNSAWTKYFDVYNSKYIDMFVQFDSWTELADIVNDKKDLTQIRDITNNITNRVMAKHKIENEQKWNDLFGYLF